MSKPDPNIRSKAPSIVWRKLGEQAVDDRLHVGEAWVLSIYDKLNGKPIVVENHWEAPPSEDHVAALMERLPLPSTWDIGISIEHRPVVHKVTGNIEADWKALQDSSVKARRTSRLNPVVLTVFREVVERMYLRICPVSVQEIWQELHAQLSRISPNLVDAEDRDSDGKIRVPCERSIRRSLAALDPTEVLNAHVGHRHRRHEIAR
jgi:hypothetical protein